MTLEDWSAAQDRIVAWCKSHRGDIPTASLTSNVDGRTFEVSYYELRAASFGNGTEIERVRTCLSGDQVSAPDGLEIDDLRALACDDGHLIGYLNYLLTYPMGFATIKMVDGIRLSPIDIRHIIEDVPERPFVVPSVALVGRFCDVFDAAHPGAIIDDHGGFRITTADLRGAIERYRDRMGSNE